MHCCSRPRPRPCSPSPLIPSDSGARLGITAVLHTWGSALTHHPHLHCIVPGGGLSLDGQRWVACKSGFFLPVRVLSRLFRRLLLEKLSAAHHAGRLQFFGGHQLLTDATDLRRLSGATAHPRLGGLCQAPVRRDPRPCSLTLSRYTHRVAISNSRLITCDERGVTFKWKDYRAQRRDRYQTMTLATPEFIRRFLIHVLPAGFHRIRHYGLLANHTRVKHVQRLRELLSDDILDAGAETELVEDPLPSATYTCQVCGTPMIIIETFAKQRPRAPPADA